MLSANSSNSGSISDVSDASSVEVCLQRPLRPVYMTSRRTRKSSVASVCTSPQEDAYVMVLQNKVGLFKDLRNVLNSKELCDVTFLVGPDRKPVYGIRAIIATRSNALYDAILAFEESKVDRKRSKMHHIRNTFSKLKKIKHSSNSKARQVQYTENGSEVMRRVKMPVPDFDPECFQRLMTYVHCGTLTVDAQTVIGLLNAAQLYHFPEMRQACWDFALGCTARDDNLRDLAESVKRYSTMKMTRELVKMLKEVIGNRPEIEAHSSTMDTIAEQLSMAT